MPKHTHNGGGSRDWLDVVYDWAGELGQASGCALQIVLTPTRRAGVWAVRVRALEMVDGRPAGVRTQVGGEWPCGDRVDLLPYVHKLVLALDDQLEAIATRSRSLV